MTKPTFAELANGTSAVSQNDSQLYELLRGQRQYPPKFPGDACTDVVLNDQLQPASIYVSMTFHPPSAGMALLASPAAHPTRRSARFDLAAEVGCLPFSSCEICLPVSRVPHAAPVPMARHRRSRRWAKASSSMILRSLP